MRKVLYVVFPAVAFVLILTNALFGHLIFGSPYDQDINKYSIYVHLEQDWNSYPGNILFEVTNVWSNPNPESDARSYSINPSDISSLTSYNSNQLQAQHQKSFVELKHEFSNCETNWKPILYRYAIDSVRAQIELVQGTSLSDDPYVSLFPDVPNTAYGAEEQANLARSGYLQFIPICTAAETTSYEYAVSLNDRDIGFDVYFVTSEDEVENFLLDGDIDYYPQDGCHAQNRQSFSGTCSGVDADSGLLIIIPDSLDLSLTKVKISLHEMLQDPA